MALQVLLVKVGTGAPSNSDGDPHGVDLVLESQQAVGDALLVAGKSNSDPFDVTVGEEEERESQGQGREVEAERKAGERDRGLCRPVVRGSSYGAWRVHTLTWSATQS